MVREQTITRLSLVKVTQMPIKVQWYYQPRIILVHVQGEAGVEQIRNFSESVKGLIAEGIEPVHVFLHDVEAGPPPISISLLKDALSIGTDELKKLGWVVGVGRPPMIANFILPLATKVFKIDYTRRDSFEQALAFVRGIDPTLPEIIAVDFDSLKQGQDT